MIGNIRSMAAFRTAVSDLVSRGALASRAGITFKGKRDLYEALGYQRQLGPDDYRQRYQRNGMAARVVESFPKATWRGGAALVEDEDPEISTAFEEAWNDLAERLQVWPAMQRTDVLAGLGRYAICLIGAPGKLEEPLPKLQAKDLLYLAPYGEDEAQVSEYVEKTDDPRFGLPLFYNVNRRTSTTQQRTNYARKVHWTRVLHVADGVLDDRVNGTPRLERVWNWLDDLEKVTGSGAEAFWLRSHQGLVFNIEKDIEIEPAQVEKLKDEAEELANQLRRTLGARGLEVTALGSDVADFSKPVTSIVSLISGATSIPQRILLGSERGQLASSQDQENWDERVSDRRLEFAEPIVRDFVLRLQLAGALPDTPDSYDVRWPEIEDLDDKGKAEVANVWSKLNAQAGGTVVTPEEIRDRVLGLPDLEPTQEENAIDNPPSDTPPEDNPPQDQPPQDEPPPDNGA